MAFLDNSGDIILDAILTDTGRQRMAEGRFRITKFAFGDDEIDYSLYNLNHPSGTAYADLEILQTPVVEATSLGIQYGLLSTTNTNILYMPSLVLNEGKIDSAVQRKNNTIYVAVNSETQKALNHPTLGFGSGYSVLTSQRGGGKLITIESSIDNSNVTMDKSNQDTYIVSQNMLDTSATVVYDNNFINSIISSSPTTTFATSADGSWAGTTSALQARTAVRPASKEGFSMANIAMSRAAIYTSTGTSTVDVTEFVSSLGIVGSMSYVNVVVDPALTTTMGQTADTRWVKFGTTGITISGLTATRTFSIIGLSLTVNGATSGASLDIPITLIKRDT